MKIIETKLDNMFKFYGVPKNEVFVPDYYHMGERKDLFEVK